MSQSKISSDYWFIYDESPDKWSIWDGVSDMFVRLGEQMSTFKYEYKPPTVAAHPIVFTDETRRFEGQGVIDAHGNTPRPAADDPTGRVRPIRTCPRHGKPMPHGRCPKCH